MPNQFTSPPVLVLCFHCGAQKTVQPSKVRARNFCTHKCFTSYWRSERQQRICANCSTPVARSVSRTHATTFCSPECQCAHTRGENHHRWQGGRTISRGGYAFIKMPDGSYKQEHRLVMEQHIGRLLCEDEVIDHLNGDKLDNRLENLSLTNQPDHARRHFALATWSKQHERCVECGSTEYRHYAHGLCRPCYRRERRRQGKGDNS